MKSALGERWFQPESLHCTLAERLVLISTEN